MLYNKEQHGVCSALLIASTTRTEVFRQHFKLRVLTNVYWWLAFDYFDFKSGLREIVFFCKLVN